MINGGYRGAVNSYYKHRIQLIAAISGREERVKPMLAAVTKALLAEGHYVINPIELCVDVPRTCTDRAYWTACMHRCLDSFADNGIELGLAINDISDSYGAKIELLLTEKFHIASYQMHTGQAFLPHTHSARMIDRVLKTLAGAGICQQDCKCTP